MLTRLFLLAILAAPVAMSQQAVSPVILGPGVYLKSELPENPQGAWLGLVQEQDDVWRLEQVSVETSPVLLEGDKPDAPRGVRVFASKSKRVMLFMRGLSLPASGARVQVAEAYYQKAPTPGAQAITGRLGAETFKIRGEAVSGADKAEVRFLWKARSQTLRALSNNEYSSWDILWAGDLDGDNIPDFIFAVAENSVGSQQLMLSSMAKPGQIVGLAGAHTYTFGN